MTRYHYIAIAVFLVSITWALQTPAQDSIGAAKEGIEQAQDPTTNPDDVIAPLTVTSEEGRTVLMTDEVDEDTTFTLSFSSILDEVQTHVELDSHGLKSKYTLVQPKGKHDTPIILELEGPAFKDGPGIRLKIRF